MQAKAFKPFGCNEAPEYRAADLEASKVTILCFPTRLISICHKVPVSEDSPPLQKGFVPLVGQRASERLSSNPPVMFGGQTCQAELPRFVAGLTTFSSREFSQALTYVTAF